MPNCGIADGMTDETTRISHSERPPRGEVDRRWQQRGRVWRLHHAAAHAPPRQRRCARCRRFPPGHAAGHRGSSLAIVPPRRGGAICLAGGHYAATEHSASKSNVAGLDKMFRRLTAGTEKRGLGPRPARRGRPTRRLQSSQHWTQPQESAWPREHGHRTRDESPIDA